MRLRAKTLLIVGATLTGLTVLSHLAARTLVMASFDAIEADAVRQNLDRAQRALSGEVASLYETTRDYSAWDETYRFAKERQADYLGQLLGEGLTDLRVAVIVILDLEGTLLHARLLDHERTLPPDLGRLLAERLAFRDSAARQGRSGVVVLPEGLWIVSACPILDNTRTKAARGTLIMGRPLDAAFARSLGEATRLDLQIRRLDASGTLPDLAGAGSGSPGVQPLSEDQIAGHAVVNDLTGKPALALTIRMPRTIHERARTTVTYFTVFLQLVGLAFGLSMVVLFEKVVLSRLERLAACVHALRERGTLGSRVDASGRDELSDLGHSINALLATVEAAQAELSEGRERYRQLFDANPHAMWVDDPSTQRFLAVNDAALAQFGYTREEFLELGIAEIYLEEDQEAVLRPASDSGEPLQHAGVWRQRRKDGTQFHAAIVSHRLLFAGAPARLVLADDITARLQAEEALRRSEERYSLAASAANDGLWDWNVATGEAYLSPRWKEMLGYQEQEIAPSPEEWLCRVHPDDLASLQAQLDGAASGSQSEHEHRMLHKDGSYLWLLSRWVTLRSPGGAIERRVGSLSDVTARKAAEDHLRREALFDALTGLPNRTLLLDLLRRALARARRHPDEACGLLFVDVDRFKYVNDSLGHAAGDELLCELARRIERCVRPEDTLARLAGDEFIVLLDSLRDPADATGVAERIQGELGRPFRLGESETFASVSIGIAISGGPGQGPEDLIRAADTAMYRAKALGRAGHQVFDSQMHAEATTLLNLEHNLRHALERSEFEVHYQPIVELDSSRVVGFEALVRWCHPTLGRVGPAQFIPLAEESGMIVAIGEWVLERACTDARSFQREFPTEPPLTLSVNLSARQLVELDLRERVDAVLKRTGFAPESLHLEITESAIMRRPDQVTVVLGQLKDLGIHVSIDDFGTGYSSLSYLHLFPVDFLKIDRSFVNSMHAVSKQRRIVETILLLARNLGVGVIAEGVEDEAQRVGLRDLGCRLGQGYLFSKPVDAAGARRLLAAGVASAVQGGSPIRGSGRPAS